MGAHHGNNNNNAGWNTGGHHGSSNGNGSGAMNGHHGGGYVSDNGSNTGGQQNVESNPIEEIFSRYFSEEQYLQNKVDALNVQSTDGKVWTQEELREICAQAGMTPRDHFYRFGAFEKNAEGTWGINPSADFDLNAYYNAKADAVIGMEHNAEQMAWMVEQFKSSNLDPLTHFGMYGRHENLTATSHSHGCQNPQGCGVFQQSAQQTVEVTGIQPETAPAVEPA